MISNEEYFARASIALWIYEEGLSEPLSEEERLMFIAEFVALEKDNAAKFRL